MANYFNVQGKKICYSNSTLEEVIFAPWISFRKCFRKCRYFNEEALGASYPIASHLNT